MKQTLIDVREERDVIITRLMKEITNFRQADNNFQSISFIDADSIAEISKDE